MRSQFATRWLASACAVVLAAQGGMALADEKNQNLKPQLLYDHAHCIAKNAEAYLALEQPAMIFSGFCEKDIFDPTPEQVAQATSINSIGSPTILFPNGDRASSNPMASMIILTTDKLECLRRHAGTEEQLGKVVKAHKETVKVSDGNKTVDKFVGEFDFTDC